MKKLTIIAIAFFLALSAIPAMAGDQAGNTSTFQAFSNLPAGQRDTLTPLTDTELAAIEGGADVCSFCTARATAYNNSDIYQSIYNTGSATVHAIQVGSRNVAAAGVNNSNSAVVVQSASASARIN